MTDTNRVIVTTAPIEDRHRPGRPFADKLKRWTIGFLTYGEDAAMLVYKVVPAGCPKPEDIPYASKVYALEAAVRAGFTSILWADTSIVACKSLLPVWEQMEKTGYWFAYAPQPNIGNWTSDAALPLLGITREQAFKIPKLSTHSLGLDFRKDVARNFLSQWMEAANNGSFRGPWNNDTHEASPDPRVYGHRHDLSAASAIADRLGMTATPGNFLTYESQVPETILKTDYGLEEKWTRL